MDATLTERLYYRLHVEVTLDYRLLPCLPNGPNLVSNIKLRRHEPTKNSR